MDDNIKRQNSKILFVMLHTSSLFQFLTLKFKKYNDSSVILLVNKQGYENTQIAQNLINEGVFENIVSFHEPLFIDSKNKEDLLNKIESFYSNILNSNDLSLDQFDDIYISCDMQNYFYYYCHTHKKPSIFIELLPNQFDDKSRYTVSRICANLPMWIEEFTRETKMLSGENSDVIHRFIYKESKNQSNKDIQIDFINEFYNLDICFKDIILRCMNITNLNIFKDCNMLLLNSIGWSQFESKLSLPQHYLPFQLIADYYYDHNNNVIFKDHPQTPCESYNKYVVPHSKTVNATIPIEFFGLINGFHINKLISVESSGNDKISRFVDKEVKLGRSCLRNFRYIHKLYITLLLNKIICNTEHYHYYGLEKEFIIKFAENFNNSEKLKNLQGLDLKILKGNIFAIIGKYSNEHTRDLENALLNADNNTKIMFFDFDYKNTISAKNIDLLNYFVPITIHKKKIKDPILSDTYNENCLWFYCKDETTRNMVKNFSFYKDLPNTGIAIFVNSSENKDTVQNAKINILQEKIKEL